MKRISILLILISCGFLIGLSKMPTEETIYPDFKTPKGTIRTLYTALSRRDLRTAQQCYVPKIDSFEKGVVTYEIKKEIVINKPRNEDEMKGDVIIITIERYKDKNTLPMKMGFQLRKENSDWKILDSMYIPDKNHPPFDYGEDFEKLK